MITASIPSSGATLLRWRPRRFCVGLLVWGMACVPAFAQEAEGDLLAKYRGYRLLVEYPSLDDVGRKIDMPKGWKYLQVSAENYDVLIDYLHADRTPEAILSFDEYGNFVKRDHSPDRLGRLDRHYQEVEKQVATWKRRLKKDSALANEARRQRREERELELLVSLRDSKLEGYPEILDARKRLAELEELRLVELWGVLASEGLVRRRALLSSLSALHDRSKGLAIAATIEAEFDRVDGGHVASDKRSRSTGR